MKMKRTPALLALVAVAILAAVAGSVKSAVAAGPTITIWADQDRKTAVTQLANAWATARGANVNVVVHDFGKIRDDLGTVAAADAPDVIMGAHDWTGQLAANGLVQPIVLSAATKAQFPAYTLNAFSYGTAVKKLYGVPTQIENIGLVVNTALVKVPTTFAMLEKEALAFKKKKAGNLAIAVQQGTNGDAYHMYPFFSGLGGYVFGVNKAGNLDPSDIGVASKAFLQEREARRQVEQGRADQLEGRQLDRAERVPQEAGGVLDHRPVELGHAQDERPEVQDHPDAEDRVPLRAVPRRAGLHGDEVRRDARRRVARAGLRRELHARLRRRRPHSRTRAVAGRRTSKAGASFSDPVLAQFGKAGKGGVPMPNIPQMGSVWTDLGQAWVRSTKGAGAAKAAASFTAAARAIADKIG